MGMEGVLGQLVGGGDCAVRIPGPLSSCCSVSTSGAQVSWPGSWIREGRVSQGGRCGDNDRPPPPQPHLLHGQEGSLVSRRTWGEGLALPLPVCLQPITQTVILLVESHGLSSTEGLADVDHY